MSVDASLLRGYCQISVNGTNLTASQQAQIAEVVVEQSLHLPSMFTIRLLDIGDSSDRMDMSLLSTIDDDVFPVGAELSISMIGEQDDFPVRHQRRDHRRRRRNRPGQHPHRRRPRLRPRPPPPSWPAEQDLPEHE